MNINIVLDADYICQKFSTFDGLDYPQEHIDFVRQNGMDAFALTNHGHMNSFAHAWLHVEKLNKAGANFKFVATAAGNNLVFNQNESSGTNVIKLNTAAATTQSVATMVLGECVECITDGTYWYVIELN